MAQAAEIFMFKAEKFPTNMHEKDKNYQISTWCLRPFKIIKKSLLSIELIFYIMADVQVFTTLTLI